MSEGFFSRRTYRIARRNTGGYLLRLFGPSILRTLARTWRSHQLGEEQPQGIDPGRGSLVAVWHGRMLVGMAFHRSTDLTVLVSPSDDGAISKRMLNAFGYRVILGSTHHGGARALREMLEALQKGEILVITPDGPRGPRHSTNPGLAWMARATGYPIIPVGMVADRAWHLRSWDDFTIPKPFACLAFCYGQPIHVGRDADADELATVTETVRAELLAAEERAFAQLGAVRDW